MVAPVEAAQIIAADYYGSLDNVVERIDVDGVSSAILRVGKETVLLIRGTDQSSDWLKYNFRFLPETKAGDRFLWHRGFLRHAQVAYAFAKNKHVDLVTGHSLGAAAAAIVAVSLSVRGLTFASPRPLFGKESPPNADLVVNFCRTDDLVTMLPPSFMGFRHCGRVVWLHPKGRNIGEDHRISHYLDLADQIDRCGYAD